MVRTSSVKLNNNSTNGHPVLFPTLRGNTLVIKYKGPADVL